MNPVRVLNLDHVVLRVVDVDRMVTFYRDVIGLQVERVNAAIGLTQMRAGASLLDLVSVEGQIGVQGGAAAGAGGRNVDHFCFRVDAWDDAALLAHLAGHGVEPGEVKERYGADGFGPSIYIRDPEGNGVELKGPPTRTLQG